MVNILYPLRMKLALLIITVVVGDSPVAGKHEDLEHYVKVINKLKTTWTARLNFPKSTPTPRLRSMLGMRASESSHKLATVSHAMRRMAIPTEFDARDHWPYCRSIGDIVDQGHCGACWAVASTSMMTDRVCTASRGKYHFRFSAHNLLSCCATCGNCNGGDRTKAFNYWNTTGIVSGSYHPNSLTCQSYRSLQYNHKTPKCQKRCVSTDLLSYRHDLKHGLGAYKLSSETEIQKDIMINGPLTGGFKIYRDFYVYGSGVYQHVTGRFVGWHAIKIIGWGVEKGVPYWLCSNSWSPKWGGEKGHFKILRGSDECHIESRIIGSNPNIIDFEKAINKFNLNSSMIDDDFTNNLIETTEF